MKQPAAETAVGVIPASKARLPAGRQGQAGKPE